MKLLSRSAFQEPLAEQYDCKKLPIKEFYGQTNLGTTEYYPFPPLIPSEEHILAVFL